MLHSIHPLPLVIAAIRPIHLAVPTPHISLVVPFVEITTRPCELAVAPLLVVFIVSLVFIAISSTFLPYSFPLPQTVDEIPLEVTLISPVVGPLPRWHSIHIMPSILVSIRKLFDPEAIFK